MFNSTAGKDRDASAPSECVMVCTSQHFSSDKRRAHYPAGGTKSTHQNTNIPWLKSLFSWGTCVGSLTSPCVSTTSSCNNRASSLSSLPSAAPLSASGTSRRCKTQVLSDQLYEQISAALKSHGLGHFSDLSSSEQVTLLEEAYREIMAEDNKVEHRHDIE